MSDIKPKIVNCDFLFKCPQRWGRMDKTENDNVRFCGTCGKKVYFADSAESFDELGRKGNCVAVWQEVFGSDVQNDSPPYGDFNPLKYPHSEITAGVPMRTVGYGETPDVKDQTDNQTVKLWQDTESYQEKPIVKGINYWFLIPFIITLGVFLGLIILGVIIGLWLV